ncbi:MAG: hypothetical protein AB7F31_06895 [Parachlamydiales bacterium]
MERPSIIDSPNALRLANFCIGVGGITALGLAAYIPAYRMGYCTHLARRVTKLGIAGLACGVLGLLIRSSRRLSPAETSLSELLPDADPNTLTPRELALKLASAPGDEEAKVRALAALIRTRPGALYLCPSSAGGHQTLFISWHPRALLGEKLGKQDQIYPELLQKALLQIFQEEQKGKYWGIEINLATRAECSYQLSQVKEFVAKFKDLKELTRVTCSVPIQTEEEGAVFLTLLNDCPKLFDVPVMRNTALQGECVTSHWAVNLRQTADQRAKHFGIPVIQ